VPCLADAVVATSMRLMPTRLKSSFIYLANAVSDLRGNWPTLALVLAPLVLIAALCLLPEAVNLQGALADRFAPGARSIAWVLAQAPYAPMAQDTPPLFPKWAMTAFQVAFFLIALAANLLVLCTLRRVEVGVQRSRILDESIAIYREAIHSAPAFAWVVFLQLSLPAIAHWVLRLDFVVSSRQAALLVDFAMIILMVLGVLIYLWLYFAPFALIFDGEHSFRALLFSRDLLRKRFFRAATRIMVFLAVWLGYNIFSAILFLAVSLILGPVAGITGYIWGTIFLIDLATVAVFYATSAFFIAAGARLYQDLRTMAAERVSAASAAMPATAPLSDVTAPAAR
jgi:hypothetical protein